MFTIRWRDVFPPEQKIVVSWSKREPGEVFPRHKHDFDELFWVESGSLEHELNGVSTTLDAGSLVFIHADDVHQLTWGNTRAVLVNIALARGILPELGRRLFPHDRIAWWADTDRQRVWQLRPEDVRALTEACFEIGADVCEQWRVERFLLNVIALQHPLSARAVGHAGEPVWLWQARRAMAAPARLRKGVAALVALSGCTPEHVARTVRRVHGVTPTEWVNEARLHWAAERLRYSVDPIADIAAQAGFESLSHFYHLFRELFHDSPRRFRNRYQARVA